MEAIVIYYRHINMFLQHSTGLPPDQVNMALSLFLSFPLAHLFRTKLHPRFTSGRTRYILCAALGVLLLNFCFGWQAMHVVASAVISYAVLIYSQPESVHRNSFASAMLYLLVVHIMRFTLDSGVYVIDISGPMMVLTQKIVYVGFHAYDKHVERGKERDALHETDAEKRDRLQGHVPGLLEYFSYVFNFTSVFCGPAVDFQTYKDFIHGTQYAPHMPKDVRLEEPSPVVAATKRFICGYILVATYSLLCPYLYPHRMVEADMMARPLISRILFAHAIVYSLKAKYFAAFLTSESICVMAGLGFTGYDSEKKPTWNAVRQCDVYNFEISLNLKGLVDNWNIATQVWLRRTVYERVPCMPMVATFFVSAVWHGVHPTYYLFFLSVALLTAASRLARRTVRPLFLTSKRLKVIYDVMTLAVVRLLVDYLSFAFALMDLPRTMLYWRSMYYFGHVLPLAFLLILSICPGKRPAPKKVE